MMALVIVGAVDIVVFVLIVVSNGPLYLLAAYAHAHTHTQTIVWTFRYLVAQCTIGRLAHANNHYIHAACLE